VTSRATQEFWTNLRALPRPDQHLALKNYRLWRANPRHPGLHFKKVGPLVWSARVGREYRAVAAPVPGGYVWFWIGPHDAYEQLIAGMA
jgi:hypothetical protein